MRLVLALLLAVQVALVPESAGWPCPEDDGADCEAGCTDCASCGHSAIGDVADAPVGLELTMAVIPPRVQRPPRAPEPADILHVPIALA